MSDQLISGPIGDLYPEREPTTEGRYPEAGYPRDVE